MRRLETTARTDRRLLRTAMLSPPKHTERPLFWQDPASPRRSKKSVIAIRRRRSSDRYYSILITVCVWLLIAVIAESIQPQAGPENFNLDSDDPAPAAGKRSDRSSQPFRPYENEDWNFAKAGLLYWRNAAINELQVDTLQRLFRWTEISRSQAIKV